MLYLAECLMEIKKLKKKLIFRLLQEFTDGDFAASYLGVGCTH